MNVHSTYRKIRVRDRVWWWVRDFVKHPDAFAKFYYKRTVGRWQCRHGHEQDEIAKMLGFCPRCYAETPTQFWAEVGRQAKERGQFYRPATDAERAQVTDTVARLDARIEEQS